MTDADVKTTYLGDSVYISELPGNPTTFSLFLNNGERHSPAFLERKCEIVIEPEVAVKLIVYMQERLK